MTALLEPTRPQHLVVIIGGAVAGSEAAAVWADRGAVAIVLDQNDRPYGKIEDGLPRWHDKLQRKEYERIGHCLTRPGVHYVPRTALGRDLSLATLMEVWQPNAVLLASGAWRDRALPIAGVDAFTGRGLLYQNPFVHWYNHYPEACYDGPKYTVPDGAIVVGGGLASIDVVKILNFQIYKSALAQRGIQVTTLELEHHGIPHVLEAHGLSVEAMGLRGASLYYRRSKREMPLASAPPGASESQRAKIGDVREKLMNKVSERYLARFEGNLAPLAALTEGERLTGLRFQRTATVNGKLVAVEGETLDVRADLVVSSIGSIPEPIAGIPMDGELIDFADRETGRVRGIDHVYALGNALTGKGNIKESRKNATELASQVSARYLGIAPGAPSAEGAHQRARESAGPALEETLSNPPRSPEQLAQAYAQVRAHWHRSGYTGDYAAWIAAHQTACEE